MNTELEKIDQEDLDQMIKDHQLWLNNDPKGKRLVLVNKDLRGSDLSGSNLIGSDLRGCDIDYACWPLWCGSFDVKVDKRIFTQLAYHLCKLDVDENEELKQYQELLKPIANQFHRIDRDCERLI